MTKWIKINPLMLDVPEEIETERLSLQAPKRGDGPALCEALQESVAAMASLGEWVEKSLTPEGAEADIRKSIVQFASREHIRYNIFDKATSQLIGGAGLYRTDWSVPCAEIGYWCRASRQGEGIATEASKALVALAFEGLQVQRLELRCDVNNHKSQRVAEKLSFHLEGRLRHNFRNPGGVLLNSMLYSMIPEEFAALK